jgi:hypothetical protein
MHFPLGVCDRSSVGHPWSLNRLHKRQIVCWLHKSCNEVGQILGIDICEPRSECRCTRLAQPKVRRKMRGWVLASYTTAILLARLARHRELAVQPLGPNPCSSPGLCAGPRFSRHHDWIFPQSVLPLKPPDVKKPHRTQPGARSHLIGGSQSSPFKYMRSFGIALK